MSEIVPALIQLFDVAFIHRLLGGLLLLLGAGLGFLVARKIAVTMVNRMIALTGTQWDDALATRGVFTQATYLAPAVVLYYGISFFPGSTDIVGRKPTQSLTGDRLRVIFSSLIWRFICLAGC